MADSEPQHAGALTFKDCRIDLKRRELARAGEPVAIEPKAFRLLAYLIEHRDRAVGKDELQDEIWPGTIVTEASLTRCISKARRAVGDDPKRQEIIKTVQRHGYRFVAALDDVAETGAAETGEQRNGTTFASIAVLPFVDLSPEQDQQYFSDGMAEELMNRLSRLDGIKVAGRSTSFRFRGSDRDAWAIGTQLGVNFLLEGSVQKLGGQLRVRLQLVDARTGYQVWSQNFENQVEDVFAVQDEIARQVAESVKPTLTPLDRAAIRHARVSDFEAYDYYLRGLEYFHRFTERDFRLAIDMFGRAVATDPGYTEAHAGMANGYACLYQWFDAQAEHLEAAKQASAKAIAINPDMAEAHTAHGVAVSLERDYEGAEQAFRTAIALDPNCYEGYYLYGRVCVAQGKHAQAAELFERAADLRDDEFQCRYLAAQSFMALGLTSHMETWARKTIDVVEPLLALNPDNIRALYLGSGAWSMLGNKKSERVHETVTGIAAGRSRDAVFGRLSLCQAWRCRSGDRPARERIGGRFAFARLAAARPDPRPAARRVALCRTAEAVPVGVHRRPPFMLHDRAPLTDGS